MISCVVVYLLQIFKMFHRLMNNLVYVSVHTCTRSAKNLIHTFCCVLLDMPNTRVIQILEIQNRWEGKGHHHFEGWHHPTPSPKLTPRDFHLFLNLKEHLAGQMFHEGKEVKNSHYMVARAGGRVLWHRNTNTRTQAKQMPWQMRWLCWKIAKCMC